MGEKKLLICIPTYNEKDNVPPLVKAIFENVSAGVDILFIDDNSPDGTGALIDGLKAENPRVNVLHRKGKLGLASAYVAGFKWGLDKGYEWIMEMDADFSHDPVHLKQVQHLIDSGSCEAIVGSRYIAGGGVSNWSPARVMLSKMGSIYARMWLRFPVTDFTGGFNAWKSSLLKNMYLDGIQSKGYAFQIELKYRALELGAKLVETPIVFQERRFGASKMSGDIIKEAVVGVILLRLKRERDELFTS